MIYTMQPFRTICTYDIYNGLVRPFPLLEDMLKDPASRTNVKALELKSGTSEANLKLLAFLEEMLSSPPTTDISGAERVLTAAKEQQIGVALEADHTDLPLIMRYCNVHQDAMPLTCLMLIAYGHTKEWTQISTSQHIHPQFRAIVEKLDPSPMVARAAVEFTIADYELNDWLSHQVTRALPKLGYANDVLRKAEMSTTVPIEDAGSRLAGALRGFVKKSGSLASGLMELSASALSKLPLPDGTLVNAKELEHAGLVMDLLSDHAYSVWPFANKIAPADLFGLCNDFFDQNQRSRDSQQGMNRAFDDSHTCTWMLMAIAGEDGDLSERFLFSSKNDEERTASLLSSFMSKVNELASDESLKQLVKLKLTAGLSNWIGFRNLFQTNIGLSLQNEILRSVFQGEQLGHLDPLLSDNGRKVITSYVMAEHRSLARQLTRKDRGLHLADDLGL